MANGSSMELDYKLVAPNEILSSGAESKGPGYAVKTIFLTKFRDGHFEPEKIYSTITDTNSGQYIATSIVTKSCTASK